MTEINKKELLDQLKDLSVKAGDAIMEVYNSGDFQTEHKDDDRGSPLTIADTRADKIITDGLKKLYPDIPILSEEGTEIDYEVRKEWDKFFLIDPLDGTKEFIKKRDEFTVNIALIEKGFPTVGVVFGPAIDVMYSGIVGIGAWQEFEGKTMEINAKSDWFYNGPCNDGDEESNSNNNLKIVASKSHRTKELEDFLEKVAPSEDFAIGSSLKLCIVAEGGADLYVRFGPTMEWDTGAAHAVVNAAGGKVCKVDGFELVYNKENLLNPPFIVEGSNPFNWKDFL